MDFNQLLVLVIDKVIIGILLLLVGLWINKRLSQHKSNLEEDLGTKVRIAEARLPAYKSLWELTFQAHPDRVTNLTSKDRQDLLSTLIQWFYKEGQGLFLTEQSSSLFDIALKSLRNGDVNKSSETDITEAFKTLRRCLKDEIGIYGRKSGYKYRLAYDFSIHTGIMEEIKTDYIQLSAGILTLKSGYAWDGPSGPTIDTKNMIRGSLVHDALYQLMRTEYLSHSYRKEADLLLRKMAIEDGVSRFRANLLYQGVKQYGSSYARSKSASDNRMVYYDNHGNIVSGS